MTDNNNKSVSNNSPSGVGSMEYNFREIEKKWQEQWNEKAVYKVPNDSLKPKCYVLDMFPYPSGAGLHVGHPLGYIASDIYARYKRLKGFNVLHPMGYDAFGLPAEQYAIEHGVHPAVSTAQNIQNFRSQLDKIGFSFDWSREVNTSDPKYYKWTQWIFLQLFKSWYNRKTNRTEQIDDLIKIFETEGNKEHPIPNTQFQIPDSHVMFTAEAWKSFTEKIQQTILMEYRIAYCGIGEVNWCEALGTVLANDEVVNGVSERGGYSVVKKKLRQWYLRITEYADRLLEGLHKVDFSEAMKEMQGNWIGKSSGAEIEFYLTPGPSPAELERGGDSAVEEPYPKYKVGDKVNFENARKNREEYTEAEGELWEQLRDSKLGYKFRRQHPVENYIADFACLPKGLIVEVDGGYHDNEEQQKYDADRTAALEQRGFTILRFSNEEILENVYTVRNKIKEILASQVEEKEIGNNRQSKSLNDPTPLSSSAGEGLGVRCYTTRPDTIFGVDFMVIAPEHELIEKITTPEQKTAVEEYLAYVKSRSERERMAEKRISGVFTGAYAINPFDGREIPVWISEYVLAGYGTGAIMAVPCGDERDHKFAQHFGIPITNIIGDHYNGEEANPTKEAILQNSDFINGIKMRDAIEVVINKIEELGIGKRKVNYKMRDAAFSRQRYWGEPFPIVWKDGIAYVLEENELPLELPFVESYKPGPEGEGPLANIKEWTLTPGPSPQVERGVGAALVPKYKIHTPVQYELAKQMRKGYTEAEGLLWERLRNNKTRVKFRRQHPIDAYIVDFVSLQDKLIVEVDGGYHENEEQKKYDAERTRILNDIGFTVLRFTNDEIKQDAYIIRNKIKEVIANQNEANTVGGKTPLSTRGEGPGVRETNTMPGYAGSSWYFLRYMDPHNEEEFCNKKFSDYWNQVDLYVGGTEHAVGHLLYSRMWTKALYDLGHISFDEPYRKLLNQGMIQGVSQVAYVRKGDFEEGASKGGSNTIFVPGFTNPASTPEPKLQLYSAEILNEENKEYFKPINIPVDVVSFNSADPSKNILDIDLGINLYPQRLDAIYVVPRAFYYEGNWRTWNANESTWSITEKQNFYTTSEVEKMSKSKYNVVNPDQIVNKYGADTFRMYEMFLGPVEMSKPWDTKGIEGVHRFLKKLWRLFFDEQKGKVFTDEKATSEELKVLHKTIKKIEEDTERFSYNTAVSAFMVCVNDLMDLKCHKRETLEPLIILLTPYAPHISEELWHLLGNTSTILDASFPKLEEKYLVEYTKEYPVSINGKLRTQMILDLNADQQQVEELVLQNSVVQKWLEGRQPKKIIYVKNKMVNVVI